MLKDKEAPGTRIADVISLVRARRARLPRRRVHRKKLLGAQILPFPLGRRDDRAPGRLRDAIPLPPLAHSPLALTNVGGHFGNGTPAIEHVPQGPHGAEYGPDELSDQAPPIIPLTARRAERTILPMGRGTTPARFRKELAARLKSARIVAGYRTKREAAEALGIALDRYTKWENGRTPVPPQYVQIVCAVFNIDANYLFAVGARETAKKSA